MKLFGFGKNEDKAIQEDVKIGSGENVVKVLGTGCDKCSKLFKNAVEACESTNYSAIVTKEGDVAKIASYGVMSVPALVLNEKLISQGKVLKVEEIKKILRLSTNA